MNNKQLLANAAKAAGYDFTNEHGRPQIITMFRGHLANYGDWNPIDDGADSFRLMVDCIMDIAIYKDRVVVVSQRGELVEELFNDHNNDKHAATRMAIVRAVAQSQGGGQQ